MFGFGISGFRSFGPDPQFFAPLGKINLFVGQNNVGKSNALRALAIAAKLAAPPDSGPPGNELNRELDTHKGRDARGTTVFLGSPCVGLDVREYVVGRLGNAAWTSRERGPENLNMRHVQIAETILRSLPQRDESCAWWGTEIGTTRLSNTPRPDQIEPTDHPRFGNLSTGVAPGEWKMLWSAMTGSSGGGLQQHWIPEVLKRLSPFGTSAKREVHRVEPYRQIGKPGTEFEGLNGQGLIARLAALERPVYARQDDKKKFEAINTFLREVTGCTSARLEVASAASELLAEIDGKMLPVESLGTGLQEVVILAAAATAYEDSILCLEEPEVHMHPRFQKRLLAYLRDHTSNQYFITTHSGHLLDAKGVAAWHFQLNEHGETVVERLDVESKRAGVCFDLGYRPSDFVQANCVVWVEGPSDRVYLHAWLSAAAPDLVEGEHYSVMFYGGRLLSHLEVSDEPVGEFIELQRLNRNVAVVMDSDKAGPDAPVGEAKRRIERETRDKRGLAWITQGREIENYIETSAMVAARESVHPQLKFLPAPSEWDCAYATEGGRRGSVDKIRIAKAAVQTVNLDVLDLRVRVGELVEFIRRANK